MKETDSRCQYRDRRSSRREASEPLPAPAQLSLYWTTHPPSHGLASPIAFGPIDLTFVGGRPSHSLNISARKGLPRSSTIASTKSRSTRRGRTLLLLARPHSIYGVANPLVSFEAAPKKPPCAPRPPALARALAAKRGTFGRDPERRFR
jgi:hypothetical protein